MEISGIYAGQAQILKPSGQRTGIYKKPLSQATIGALGISVDTQVDKRYHGGPSKALHQFAVASYAKIVGQYPGLQGEAVPGSIGENLTIPEMTERSVCIGDIYRLGQVVVQVSEPRQPCWKINARYRVDKLSEFIEAQGITGWYYRVLEGGQVALGDAVVLADRFNAQITIDYFNRVTNQHRPSIPDIDRIIAAQGLADGMKKRLQDRRAYFAD